MIAAGGYSIVFLQANDVGSAVTQQVENRIAFSVVRRLGLDKTPYIIRQEADFSHFVVFPFKMGGKIILNRLKREQ